jgi:RNA polymerase sigma-70 factor (ECF subfamily)
MAVFDLFSRSRTAREKLEQQRSRLYRVAYAWTHNPSLADDLVQETLTKAWQKSAQLRDPGAGEAWLFSILANCHQDHIRRSRETAGIDDANLVDESTPESHKTEREIVERVRAAIGKLPTGQRQVVTLVDLEGFSYMEVANILRVPIGTVMSRLCRARNELKRRLLTDSGAHVVTRQQTIRRIK